MLKRDWKWFKHGYQWDIQYKALSYRTFQNSPLTIASTIVIITENKDKEDARRMAIDELKKCGYIDVEVRKIIPRF